MCLGVDMADDRIRSLQAVGERPTHKGLCVDTENDYVYTNPEEKVDDFRREADMQSRVIAAAHCLMLGDMVPDLVGPGLCFVGPEKDPAIVTRHLGMRRRVIHYHFSYFNTVKTTLGAPESVCIRWKTTRDIADMIRGKMWHCCIQLQANVVQGDDYGRNTLGKRKRNGPFHTWLIDYGWAGHVPKPAIQDILFAQLVGFFIEFVHINHEHAMPVAKDMMLKALDIIASGRPVVRYNSTHKCIVPMYVTCLFFLMYFTVFFLTCTKQPTSWKNIRVWRSVYPEDDVEFVRQKGSNCKPRKTFKRMESIHAIKRKLLDLADRGYRGKC